MPASLVWLVILSAWVGFLVRAVEALPSLEAVIDGQNMVILTWSSGDPSEMVNDTAIWSTRSLKPPIVWSVLPAEIQRQVGFARVELIADKAERFFRLGPSGPTTVRTSPIGNARGVSPLRETVVSFSRPLQENARLLPGQFTATVAGRQLLTRTDLAIHRRKATLFFLEPMPPNCRVQVRLDGAGLRDVWGQEIDADGDGQAGGTLLLEFETANRVAVDQTGVTGRVLAAERIPDPTGAGQAVNRPLQGVTITVDGGEETLRTTTDANGDFTLIPAPAGRIFVHIDGRTATSSVWPNGAYYPFVGKAWEVVAGRTNNLAGGTGEIFLPQIRADALQPVNASVATRVELPAAVIAANPELAGTGLTFPPNSLFSDDGTRGGRVGLAPVPPDRLPGPVPEGLSMPLVITVQTDGPANFDQPIPVCFPNVADTLGNSLPAGAQAALMSFNHDVGEWERVGSMTVSEDGRLICSDPGSGILQPGWHGRQFPDPDVNPGRPPPPAPKAPTSGPQCGPGAPAAGSAPSAQGAVHGSVTLLAGNSPCPPCGDCGKPQALCDCLDRCRRNHELDEELCRLRYNNSLLECQRRARDEAFECRRQIPPALASTDPELYARMQEACDILEQSRLRECESLSLWDYSQCLEAARERERFCELDYAGCGGMPRLCNPAAAPEQLGAPASAASLARVQLATLPPASVADRVRDAFAQIDLLIAPYLRDGDTLPDSVLEEVMALRQNAAAEVGGDLSAFLLNQRHALERDAVAVHGPAGEFFGDQPPYPIHLAYQVVETETVFTCLSDRTTTRTHWVRALTEPFAQYRLFLPQSPVPQFTRPQPCPPTSILAQSSESTLLRILLLDPRTKRIGEAFPRRISGVLSGISGVRLYPFSTTDQDTDQDGLPDLAEEILGTDSSNPDTDGDGIRDGAELDQNSNPLDALPARVGIMSSTPVAGVAQDVAALNDQIVVATGQAGVAVFRAIPGESPVLIAQVDTPGSASAVACDQRLVAVADGDRGVAVLQVNVDPRDGLPVGATPLHQVPLVGKVTSVTAAAGVAYAGTDQGSLHVIDLTRGRVETRLVLPQAIHDLAVSQTRLFCLLARSLQAYSLQNGELRFLSETIASSYDPEGLTRRKRLVVGGGYAYAAAYPGYDTVDVRDPTQLRWIGRATDGGPNSFKQMAINGTGLGIAAVGINPRNDGTHDLWVYDVTEPSLTTRVKNQIVTPGLARALALYGGQAYVADSDAGLHVVNYLPFDTAGVPPRVRLSASFSMEPAQAESGSLASVEAQVTDDVQVRAVEFYLDGALVVRDGNFPFEHSFYVPTLSESQRAFKLRARAIDTGGNAGWSDELKVALLPDTVPPRLVQVMPPDQSLAYSLSELSGRFSEPLDPVSISQGRFMVLAAGADQVFGTDDDHALTNGRLAYNTTLQTVSLTFDQPLGPGLFQATLEGGLTDLNHNRLVAGKTWTVRVLEGKDSDNDGLSDDAELALGLNPSDPDSDHNGVLDGAEDPDRDGLSNGIEMAFGTNPTVADSDANGILDGDEDVDGDRLPLRLEHRAFSNPRLRDTDGDGWNDEAEVTAGSRPIDRRSTPRSFVCQNVLVDLMLPLPSTGSPGAILGSPMLDIWLAAPAFHTTIVGSPLLDLVLRNTSGPNGQRVFVMGTPVVDVLPVSQASLTLRAQDRSHATDSSLPQP